MESQEAKTQLTHQVDVESEVFCPLLFPLEPARIRGD